MPDTPDDFFADLPLPGRRRLESLDVYPPPGRPGRRPAVVFVHGGPIPPGHVPRDSAVFTGYGVLAAAAGLVGITFDHPLHGPDDLPRSAATTAAVLDRVRDLDEVEPDRIALWCFSGGGPLAADGLRATPPWLRAIAWTYPVLTAPDVRFDCVAAAAQAPDLPKLLVRVGAEYPQLVPAQDTLVATAGHLDVVEIPHAAHGFEAQGHDAVARRAVDDAMAWTVRALGTRRSQQPEP